MKKPEDILQFVTEWTNINGIADDVKLTDKQITNFVEDLQKEISEMDFSVNKGTTIIGYSGKSNGEDVWKIVENVEQIKK